MHSIGQTKMWSRFWNTVLLFSDRHWWCITPLSWLRLDLNQTYRSIHCTRHLFVEVSRATCRSLINSSININENPLLHRRTDHSMETAVLRVLSDTLGRWIARIWLLRRCSTNQHRWSPSTGTVPWYIGIVAPRRFSACLEQREPHVAAQVLVPPL